MTAHPVTLCVLLLCGSPSLPDDIVPCPPSVSAPNALGTVQAAFPALEGAAEVALSTSPSLPEQGASDPDIDSRRGALDPLASCDGSSNHADDDEPTRDFETSPTVEPEPVQAPRTGTASTEPSAAGRTDLGVEQAEATSVPVDMGGSENVETSEEAGSSTEGEGPAEPETEVPEPQEGVVSSGTSVVDNNEKNGMVGRATPKTAQTTTLRSEGRADSHLPGGRPASDAEERPPSKKVEEPYTTDPVGHFAFAEASAGGAFERVVGATSTTLLILLGLGTLALRLSVGWPRFPPLYLGRRRLGGETTDH